MVRLFCLLLLFSFLFASPVKAADPWRLGDALDLPDWFEIDGDLRLRYERQDGRFRQDRRGGDQTFVARTLLRARAHAGSTTFEIELQDARAYLDDSETTLSTGLVNPIDILQANATFRWTGGGLGKTARSDLKIGRMTLDIGSRRSVGRNLYRNTINAFTGAYLHTRWGADQKLHAFYVSPIGREPFLREDLNANALRSDQENFGRRFWAAHYLHIVRPRLTLEGYVYGYREQDRPSDATRNRRFVTPGVRVAVAPSPRRWEGELEISYRTGEQRATSASDDVTDIDVEAHSIHAHLGYQFGGSWKPRLVMRLHESSGDRSSPDKNERFTPLFGLSRPYLSHTSLFGALTRANLQTAGLWLQLRPAEGLELLVYYDHAQLASATDAWVPAGFRDPSGSLGRQIGHHLETRLRYWIIPKNARLEFGTSAIARGRFAEAVPPAGNADPFYAYGQVHFFF